jgi:prepilin-type N-terminal cleavage/methylation domain-containing protein
MSQPVVRRGFTLTELMVVIVIISIIITFLLVAAQDSRRRAEEAATLALIVKLEGGINDRLEALLQTRPDPNNAHMYMASVWYNNTSPPPVLTSSPRAQVIAWYDFLKSELPDVFFVQNLNPGSLQYPLNFAFSQNGYPGTTIDAHGLGNFMLPIGNSVANVFPTQLGDGNLSNTVGTGIYGASYFAAAGIYKNLGYSPAGYDGVDNNGNGLIDEWGEGGNPTALANLAAHKHHTARSEMLYAILVEGVGPLGSVFNRDDFSDREVKDTDGDGLPEFVDAWGQPLQFFRWPLMYHTDTQRAVVIDFADLTTIPPTPNHLEVINPPYRTVFEAREQDALDPNQQLMAPQWWSNSGAGANGFSPFATLGGPAGSLGASGGVMAFEYFFHRLTEPVVHTGASAFYWDRGASYPARRAFFTRPLIVSSGPDRTLGIFLFADNAPPTTGDQLIHVENNAIPFDPALFNNSSQVNPGAISDANSIQLRESGRDDISNQARSASGANGGP